MSKLIHIDQDYKQWIQDLKSRYRRSQIKASVKVNYEVLSFYWQLGRDIVQLDAENRWGSGFMRMLSQDLKQELPEATGLTQSNLYYCKKFYLLYNQENIILPQVVGKIESNEPNQIVPQVGGKLQDEKLPQLGAEMQTLLSAVPWGHHRYIMDKCGNDVKKALFYVRQTVENGWSRAMLLNWLDSNLYDRQGKAITNFSATLPTETSDLARELTKDPYDFAFAEVTGKFNETKLKAALLRNMTQFLVELGTGFAYVGREYRLQIGSTENVIDLLFYNLTLRCYVAIEVKIDMFDARDIGQLGTYVTAVNHILRDPEKDNPTIGLLVCKGKDNTLAQYALESSSQPLGISEYELQKLYPTKVEGTIPTIAEIESVAQDTVVTPEEEDKKN
jgi:predicted nuclease of restriction endonuclease-like (RecB) superfamily